MKSGASKTLLLAATVVASAIAVPVPDETKPELPVTGVNIARPSGGWLNVAVETNRFSIQFFDENKEPMDADADHALARYVYAAKRPERIVLYRSKDGRRLLSPPRVRPPHVFRVYLWLFDAAGGEAIESHVFQYP
ncbi:MAG: hypothetical protein KGL35_21145 [Bradyrhizobium sp.]|nr:hypothetical protein [Bradyrhizobium sp.]